MRYFRCKRRIITILRDFCYFRRCGTRRNGSPNLEYLGAGNFNGDSKIRCCYLTIGIALNKQRQLPPPRFSPSVRPARARNLKVLTQTQL